MRIRLIVLILFAGLLLSCKAEVVGPNVEINNSGNSKRSAEVQPSPMPTPFDPTDINGKIGIADVSDGKGCLRTKNANLSESQPVSVIVSLGEPEQRILSANIDKKLEQSCARHASESTDKNPGENIFYSLKVYDNDEYDVGIAVIAPVDKVRLEKGLAQADLDGDGKPEFFRSCTGFEGVLFTIWSGKPLIGKRIWDSFYYLDYDTESNCKKQEL